MVTLIFFGISRQLDKDTNVHFFNFFSPKLIFNYLTDGRQLPPLPLTSTRGEACTCIWDIFKAFQDVHMTILENFPPVIHSSTNLFFFLLAATNSASPSCSGGGRGRKELRPHWILGGLGALQRLPQPWLRGSAGRQTQHATTRAT